MAVARGFAQAVSDAKCQCFACAVLPDYIHLVVAWHVRPIRQLVGHLKGEATRQLKKCKLWPADDRPVWGAHGWNVFLSSPADVSRAIQHVERNPLKEGGRRQKWSFVSEFRE